MLCYVVRIFSSKVGIQNSYTLYYLLSTVFIKSFHFSQLFIFLNQILINSLLNFMVFLLYENICYLLMIRFFQTHILVNGVLFFTFSGSNSRFRKQFFINFGTKLKLFLNYNLVFFQYTYTIF